MDALAKLTLQQRFRIERARSQRLLRAWNEADHPREPAGSSTGGQFTSDGGGGAASAKPKKGKGKAKKEDFDKAKIRIEGDKLRQDLFIESWNENIGEDPAQFKRDFMGGLDGNMTVSSNMTGSRIGISGEIEGAGSNAGVMVGSFTRSIDLDSKIAKSEYFSLERSARKSDVGKHLLAGNVETYQELGIEKVRVYANIDVGGYAWAKYGYVPEVTAWMSLSKKLEGRLRGSSTGGRTSSGMEAESWDMLSSDVQDDVRDRWMRDSYNEFLESEVHNWRESGQALDDAKRELAYQFEQSSDDMPEWTYEALEQVREDRKEAGEPPIPYSNKQLFDALDMKFESYHGDGRDQPEFSFDDDELREPEGFDPNQPDLPHIPPADLSKRLTKEMREQIDAQLIEAFDKKAEDNEGDLEPPSYLAETIGEYQEEYWDQKGDDDKLQHAIDYGMADIEIEDEEDDEPELELPKSEEDALLAAVRSNDPKSIWKIADSPRGKELLLGTSWDGVLNLKDPESMARFNAYVGRREQRAE